MDLDVVIRTFELQARVWKRLFDEYLKFRKSRSEAPFFPFITDRDYFRFVDGVSRVDGIRNFLKSRNIKLPEGTKEDTPGEATICGLWKRKNQLFHQLLENEEIAVYEDTFEQINKWKEQAMKMAVISSSRNCEPILQKTNLTDFFDVVIDGNILSNRNLLGKPQPDIFLEAVRQLSVLPKDAMVIEDSVPGVIAAKKGDFDLVVGITRHEHEDLLLDHGADLVLPDLYHLDQYLSRVWKHLPSAKKVVKRILSKTKQKKLYLLLDYDGTLTPIVNRPDKAELSNDMRGVLKELAAVYPVMILSGRDVKEVKKLVRLKNLFYSGNHGLELSGPGGFYIRNEDGKHFSRELFRAKKTLSVELSTVPQALIEKKRFTLALHYRNVSRKKVDKVANAVKKIMDNNESLTIEKGKKIFEIKPKINEDKENPVQWLMEQMNDQPGEILPVYIGDDTTDESAFKSINELNGISILAGSHGKPTEAKYRLNGVGEVQFFLKKLIT